MAYDVAFQAFVLVLLREAITDTLASAGVDNRVYWQSAPDDGEYPFIVFQSQDNGGKRRDFINENGWEGLITIRVHSLDPDEADTIMSTVATLLFPTISVESYKCAITIEHSIPFPVQDFGGIKIYTAAMLCSVDIQS